MSGGMIFAWSWLGAIVVLVLCGVVDCLRTAKRLDVEQASVTEAGSGSRGVSNPGLPAPAERPREAS